MANQTGTSPTAKPDPASSLTASPGALPSSPAAQPSLSLPAVGAAGGQPITIVPVANVKPAPITRFTLPALLIVGGLAALGGSSALAGAAGAVTRLRRTGRSAATWGRFLLSEFAWRRK